MLGLVVGYSLRLSDYGIIGLAIGSCKNLGAALDFTSSYSGLVAPPTNRVSCKLNVADQYASMTIKDHSVERLPGYYLLEQELGASIRLIEDLVPDLNLRLLEINFPYACPTDIGKYRKLLPCRVRFRQPEAVVRFPSKWLGRPLVWSDNMLAPVLAERCRTVLQRLDPADDWVQRVRSHLLHAPSSPPGLTQTAIDFNLSAHTLRRHLYRAGTNFRSILVNVRMQLARQYLEETHLSLYQISFQLGYEYVPNFQLAFKQYYGLPPGKWREKHSK